MTVPWLNSRFTQLANRAFANNLHHGLLLKGPSGIGKTQFAMALSQVLLCKNQSVQACGECQSCKLFAAQSHPDLHIIKSEKQIGVDLIREAIQKMLNTSLLSGNKVLVIEKADTLTESASNALLKTLEEPTANTFLLLISDKPERLLATILSRCEKIGMNPPSLDECKLWLKEQGQEGVSDSLISAYANSPYLILDVLQNPDEVSFDEFSVAIEQLKNGQVVPVELAVKWQKKAEKIIQWLQHYLHNELIKHYKDSKFWQFERECKSAAQAITNPGVNKVIILANLLSHINEMNKFEIEVNG